MTPGSIRTPLNQLFPNSYEFRELECHPGALLTPERPDDGPYVAGVEFSPFCHRPLDWQTRLTPYGDPGDRQRSYRRGHQQPTQAHTVEDTATLAGLLETMARAEFPMLYQVLLRPKPDWSAQLIDRRYRIENYRDTLGSALVEELMPPVDSKDTRSLRAGDEQRLEELDAKDARRSFDVTVRAAVIGEPDHWDDPWSVHRAADELTTALEPIGTDTYGVTAQIRPDETAHRYTLPQASRSSSRWSSARSRRWHRRVGGGHCLPDDADPRQAGPARSGRQSAPSMDLDLLLIS